MKLQDNRVRLSASDVSNHLGCRHLTTLNHRLARGELERPPYRPATEVLQHRGVEHERAYLDHLRGSGIEVRELPEAGNPSANLEATLAAMSEGVDAIAQATFFTDDWFGRTDVLLKVDHPSALGPWSYEVVDTKLSQTTKAGTILQLCLYSELLGDAQGLLPRQMHVVVPRRDFQPESYRIKDYLAYYRLVRERLSEAVAADPTVATTYPSPTPHCEICQWWKACDEQRRRDDHLCLVADLGRQHETQLSAWGVSTLTQLATTEGELPRPERGSRATYEKLRHQARLQLESREISPPKFELLPIELGRGFCRLPEPSPGDIFLDLEGDAFVEPHGLEYVIGWVVEDQGKARYEALWSLDDSQEKDAFDRFVTFVANRLEQYPDLHIYHYAPYEPTAFKRLMGKHAAHEDVIDALLRGEKFVDLYAVVKQSLRAGVERYSIKDLEPLYGFERKLPLREASTARFVVEAALEMGHPEDITPERRHQLDSYNRDDCVSTLELRNWLETLRSQRIVAGHAIPRPSVAPQAPSENATLRQERIRAIQKRLLSGVPELPEERDADQENLWLLSHLMDWFRLEEKAGWWEFFHLAELTHEQRFDERKALADLRFTLRSTEKPGTEQCPVDTYRFPPQEVDTSEDRAWADTETTLGTIVDIDPSAGTIDVKKSGATRDLHPESIFLFSSVSAGVIETALLRIGEWILDHGLDSPQPTYRAARDLLQRQPPRGLPRFAGSLRQPHEDFLACARRLALSLDGGVLPIQGPPGCGKTYTGARMIVELIRQGKKVGITANSHKVIRNLLDETVRAANEEGQRLQAIQRVSSVVNRQPGPIKETTSNSAPAKALAKGTAQLAAGTAWLWAREEMADSVDVLVVDEAGQMSLAAALAVSQAARSLILIGDPQQLEQPIQGSHPDGTDRAALDHLLDGRHTVPPDLGLFLGTTWRLHPSICTFTSELYYDDRLEPRPDLVRQSIQGPNPIHGARLVYLPVEHRGNQSSATEEVEAIGELIDSTLASNPSWTDRQGKTHPLTLADILIVAPYNAQVMQLSQRLPNARVGTVDKFQGQEAPVVIYSMTSSSPEDAPRGMEFLYNPNRLNVATSRARCLCILVGSPALLEPECRTPRQIELANGLCRYRELA